MKKFKSIGGGKLEVKFQLPKPLFTETLAFIKEIKGRLWEPRNKVWLLPDTQEVRNLLLDNGFTGDSPIPSTTFEIIKPVIAPVDSTRLHPDLHPYQIEGVGFLLGRNGCGLIGDEVGLGKSNISISYIHYTDMVPALVVCPASIKTNWSREIKKWTNRKSIILSGQTGYKIPKRDFVIINYDILASFDIEKVKDKKGNEKKLRKMKPNCWLPYLQDYGFKAIILDEAHSLKNPDAMRTKAFFHIVEDIPHRIFMTATPMKNRPSDLWTTLHCLDSKKFPNYYAYLNKYCDPKFSGFGWTYKGLTNGEELASLVSPLMLRREKRDVLADLPQRQIFTVSMELEHSALNKSEKARTEFKEWALGTVQKAADKKAHIETLRALAYIGKRKSVIEWIENFLESGKKLIVMAHHRNVIDDLHDVFKGVSLVIDGRTKDRQKIVDDFTDKEKYRLLIGQIQAAGVGLNIVVASDIAMIEPPYTPADTEQCFGRIDRITQKADTVTLYHLVGEGTVDEDILMILSEKAEMIGKVLDGGKTADLFGGDLEDILVDMWRKK